MEKIDEILENMEFLDNWEDKYKYIIELGQGLDILPDDLKSAQTKVNGCVSQVWLHSTVTDSKKNEKYIRLSTNRISCINYEPLIMGAKKAIENKDQPSRNSN